MHDCPHNGARVYARRQSAHGATHICVQCLVCFQLVKLPEHGYRPFLRLTDVPAGQAVYDWIDKAADK